MILEPINKQSRMFKARNGTCYYNNVAPNGKSRGWIRLNAKPCELRPRSKSDSNKALKRALLVSAFNKLDPKK